MTAPDDIHQYLTERLQKSTYRGLHLAQHNRLPESKAVVIVKAIHDQVGTGMLAVPPDRATPADPAYADYFAVIDAICAAGETASLLSLKKNHFPNFEAMGWLDRFDRQGSLIDPAVPRTPPVATVRLSSDAVSFLHASAYQRSQSLGSAMQRMLSKHNFLDDLYAILEEVDFLNVHELMLIVSDTEIDAERKLRLIRSYRRLKRIAILELHATIEFKCLDTLTDPTVTSKTEKRDWHNWWNQSQQIMTALKSVHGFVVIDDERVTLTSSTARSCFVPRRSSSVRSDALAWHGLSAPIDGWDLHHIYPVEYATCESDLQRIDAKQNLLYLPRARHQQIPTRGNRSVRFTYDASRIALINPVSDDGKPEVVLTLPREAVVRAENLPVMAAYNDELLQNVA